MNVCYAFFLFLIISNVVNIVEFYKFLETLQQPEYFYGFIKK